MKLFNKTAIENYGSHNTEMSDDSPGIHFDSRMGRLTTYLDLQLVKSWALPRIPDHRRGSVRILDVGAGKGRMVDDLARMAKHCVAIEPYPEFYSILEKRRKVCNLETYPLTLAEYAAINNELFDIIFISGVMLYLSDEELPGFLNHARSLLRKDGVLICREQATDKVRIRHPGLLEIARTPEEIAKIAAESGFRIEKKRRAYPINIPWIMRKHAPNAVTEIIWRLFSARPTYPLWEALARMNITFNHDCFMAYLFVQDPTRTS
jgi:SAM-dependent methyltransferase